MRLNSVLNDLARFTFLPCNFRRGAFLPKGSQGAFTQFYQTWRGHRAIIAALHFCQILLHFQTRAAQNWVMLKTTPNFALF